MSFRPVLPMSGFAGWQFLGRTLATQKTAFVESTVIKRSTEHFRDQIASIRTADDLVADRRLLEVALGAFGLDDDINSKAFILKVLEEGTIKTDAFANKLADKRYAALARTFGFGDLGPRTNVTTFADEILSRYQDRQFEAAVGEQDESLRLALNFAPALADILKDTENDDARWFAVMGNAPLRQVVEGALGLPSSFGRIDLDRQLEVFRDRTRAAFGSEGLSALATPEAQEKITRLFLIRQEVSAGAFASGQSIALALLRA